MISLAYIGIGFGIGGIFSYFYYEKNYYLVSKMSANKLMSKLEHYIKG